MSEQSPATVYAVDCAMVELDNDSTSLQQYDPVVKACGRFGCKFEGYVDPDGITVIVNDVGCHKVSGGLREYGSRS